MFHKEGFKIIAFSFLMSASLVISFEILINSENIKNLAVRNAADCIADEAIELIEEWI